MRLGESLCTKTMTRCAASVNLDDVRKWMEGFSQKVIKILESKKSKDV